MVDSEENYKFDLKVRELHNHSLNPFTPKISLFILLTLFHAICRKLVWRFWYWIN